MIKKLMARLGYHRVAAKCGAANAVAVAAERFRVEARGESFVPNPQRHPRTAQAAMDLTAALVKWETFGDD